ncbi:hypothetical protein K4K61_006617 [Colletotrichum sp. SAR11_59]|nr:hypothetical protein K4K61_006617 [Colletotrichum sp. SAR11_59]
MTGSDVPRWPPEDPTPGHNHVYIAVMGVTGAGKSTLISHCTQSEVEVGHDLEGCTQVVNTYPVKYDENTTVWLVDTPGFDDTNRSDTDVLREIATWLSNAYKETKKLHGIIYLHRTTDTRLGGSAMRNLFMFQKLCGQDALKNVILATTMWEDVKAELGNKREEELKNKSEFWGGMMNKGSTVLRHQNTQESALRLVKHFVEKAPEEATTVLELQKEMVDHGRSLDQTGAGQEVDGGLAKQRESQKSHLEELQKELEEARASNDLEMARLLEEERKRAQAQMADLVQQREDLKVNLERLWEAKLAQLEAAHIAQLAEMENVRKQEKIQHELDVKEHQQKFDEMHVWSQHLGGEGPSPAIMEKGPVSLSLFGDRYWFDAQRFDSGAEPDSYASIWLGEGETFVSQRLVKRSGQSTNGGTYCAQECYLKTGYPALEDAVTAKDKNIKVSCGLKNGRALDLTDQDEATGSQSS